jgi:ABC-type polar amino acid transport system ATPase subunit
MVFQQFNLFPQLSALDPELVGEVLQTKRLLAETGMTMLVVTHKMRFAREVSNHVLFFNNGLLEEQGSPDALFWQPPQRAATGLPESLRRGFTLSGLHSSNTDPPDSGSQTTPSPA